MSTDVSGDFVVAVTVKTGVWGIGAAESWGRTWSGVSFIADATSFTTASPCTARLSVSASC